MIDGTQVEKHCSIYLCLSREISDHFRLPDIFFISTYTRPIKSRGPNNPILDLSTNLSALKKKNQFY